MLQMSANRHVFLIAILVLATSAGVLSTAAAQIGFPLSSAPRAYFVAPAGSDDAPGTVEEPLATIGRAAALVQPGETVVVRGGVYREQLKLTRGGTLDAPIVFMAYEQETPIVDGEGLDIDRHGALVTIEKEADHVTVAGFTVRNSTGAGVKIYGDYVRIAGCKVTNIDYQGIQTRGATGVQYLGNEVWETCRMNLAKEREGGWPAALTAWESSGVTYLGNTIHDNHGEGISAWLGTEDCRILGNTVYDNWSVNIYLDNSKRALVEGNLVYTTRSTFSSHRDPAIGIAIADEDYSEWNSGWTPDSAGHMIRNNLLLNCSRGISFWEYVEGSGLKDCTFANNTILGSWECGIRVAGGKHARAHFMNNIVAVGEGARVLEVTRPEGLDFDHNLFWSLSGESKGEFIWGDRPLDFELWDSQAYEFKGNLWSDPKVTDPLGTTAEDALLLEGSPAIDVALAIGAPKTDYWGHERPADGNRDGLKATDIGAHEFGAK
ncbi:MAG: right-handed parallel beta-helix repeat-containing protein [Armatimonadetes bacterium]|nr:right-handed parallel beta-helix repeat-containing protein [Armatimonadota bacterium]